MTLTTTATNMDLQKLVETLQAQHLTKKDIVVPASQIAMRGTDFLVKQASNDAMASALSNLGVLMSSSQDVYTVNPTETFHKQIADKMGIPQAYYRKMLDGHVGLLNDNVNHWISESSKSYLIRSFADGSNGIGRAFLSDKYYILDHFDIIVTALEAVREFPSIKVKRCDITENKMYVEFIDESVVARSESLLGRFPNRTKTDDPTGITGGFILSNSETGEGGFQIAPKAYIKICANGMYGWRADAKRRQHLGGRMDAGVVEWSEDTRQSELRFIMNQTKDSIKTFLRPDYWQNFLNQLEENGNKTLQKPIDTVKNVTRELNLTTKVDEILGHFLGNGDSTRFGVVQALTEWAHVTNDNPDTQNYIEERAYELVPVMDRFDREAK